MSILEEIREEIYRAEMEMRIVSQVNICREDVESLERECREIAFMSGVHANAQINFSKLFTVYGVEIVEDDTIEKGDFQIIGE